MAIGVCPQCRRRFVVEDARSFQRTCPACLRPMELPDAPDGPASDAAAGADEMLWFNGAPLVTDDLGQRVMGAIAEAAYQRSVARAQREAARRQRGQESPVRDEEPRPGLAAGAPDTSRRESDEPPGDSGPGAERLDARTAAVLERARTNCIEAKLAQGRARVIREDRRGLRDELTLLPPLDYRLLPFDFSLSFAEEAVPEAAPRAAEARAPVIGTTLYVWGYDFPTSLLCRERCESSAAAAAFARKAGWEPGRDGAWAKEITMPCGLREALRELEQILRQDRSAVGWGALTRGRRAGGRG